MKDRQFHIYLDDEEYRQVLQALIALKNNLIAQDRYTDAVDDVLIKFTKARKKKMTVQYICIKPQLCRLFLYGEAGGFFAFLGQFSRSKKFFSNFFRKRGDFGCAF